VHAGEGTEVDLRSEAAAEAGSEDVAMPAAEAVARALSTGKEEEAVSITDPELASPIPKMIYLLTLIFCLLKNMLLIYSYLIMICVRVR
jgi:hypothetical protein